MLGGKYRGTLQSTSITAAPGDVLVLNYNLKVKVLFEEINRKLHIFTELFTKRKCP